MRLFFRPDQIAVDPDFESASPRGDESKGRYRILLFPQQLRRQTDGFICVVSGYAVFDFDVHGAQYPSVESLNPVTRLLQLLT